LGLRANPASKPYTELKVYNALKANLPEGCYAWHSLSIHSEETGEFDETDFVIAVPIYNTNIIYKVLTH